MITGRLPIEGTNYAQVIGGLLRHDPVSPSQLNRMIPPEVSSVVMKSLAKERQERWQTAGEFLRALDALELGEASQLSTRTMGSSDPTQTRAVEGAVAEGSKYKQEQLSEITLKLAHYVGPIASVLVKRASSSTNNLQALVEQVAREIEPADARQKFLASVGGQVRKSGVS
jgi:serine/threonine-protein kinase